MAADPRPATPPGPAAGTRRAAPSQWSATQVRGLKAAIWLLALLPFARLLYLGATGQFGPNPLEFVTRSTGTWALVLLCVTLAVTPLRRLTGWTGLLRLRRLLGLFAFFYAAQHFLLWLAVDRGFDLGSVGADVLKRPFITVGFAAFVLMLLLAATSPHAMVRRLGGRRWQALHRSIYAIAVLVILHYWWHKAGKNDFGEVSIYAAVVAVLLGWRLLWWWRGRKNRQGATTASAR
ncbi:protein-methionine-sulfoxide reductase heme-binding subunit MsrQ [Cupriavidus sp. AU9028]|uniref:protein-methionine-sulfoxide reductase heme-binding subunit MsrQ n=1 Tax=Cupriavidus sp. AU9028 TaxID=2871157 RepID=UPI001C9481F9|nr:protein-methionine-sulfoxide reductase heme-binding subunit MsrQ [Cupriavidus sp. AU9028]MBY4898342.1 protein-methionine-sulfoxide reductase heme-binding subunit MsrQ [Cupriavidus sp. AU9028]